MGRKSKIKQERSEELTQKYFKYLSDILPLIKEDSPFFYLSEGGAKLTALLSAAEIISPLFPHLEFSLLEDNCLVVEAKKDEPKAQAPLIFA